MTSRQIIKRVITCQGTIQLVTALSVLSYQEKEQQHLGCEYENYLVIYDLYAPLEQTDAFVALIQKMATFVCTWKAIVHITPQQIQEIKDKLNCTGCIEIFKLVHSLVGVESADEIYLCRNWQFGNQLLINAYQPAQKICYGDSIGIYFSQNATAIFGAAQPSKTPKILRDIKWSVINTINNIQHNLRIKTILKNVNFDVGYFVLPNIMGESPPMKTIVAGKEALLETFQKLRGLVETEYIAFLQAKLTDAPVSILLTSNFSEADRMSVDVEISAYRKFLTSKEIEPNSILVIKPHPRDNEAKIGQLQYELADLYKEVITLSKPSLFFLPFEVLFMEAFLKPDLTPINPIQVFAVSSACLSLSLLFNVPSIIGFGEQVTSNAFYENYVHGRLQHERDLEAAIRAIA
ncbi:hypothetical protein WA1_16055 [Scytonema hofmannii PCC 7110]|uniref:Uncharacterized protein n=1 Tax=Scytonema hofmannii PCC 7110 TaxID=128403 RepID=A0A139XA44_9CYAN|nr:polysialyltransferase family glycosyltransferase [Scytonema hofmannii]KYC41564.1 hypothetical protein WA1_16055 [Scytonema hofmannii PCC 7110]